MPYKKFVLTPITALPPPLLQYQTDFSYHAMFKLGNDN